MARDIVTNLIANDKASKPLKDAAHAAEGTARSYDDLSAAEQRLALAAEKAGTAVEKAAKAAANAEQRFGKESEQARAATLRLRTAKLDLADAEEKVAAKARAAGDAADDATKQVRQLAAAADKADVSVARSGNSLGKLGGILGKVAPTLGLGVARMGAFGTVALTVVPAVISLGAHIAVAGVNFARFSATAGPAAASLLPLAAGLTLVTLTLKAMGPALGESVSTLAGSFTRAGDAAGVHAAKGVAVLSRAFVKLNMPAIRAGMLTIGDSVNGVVLSVGKWLNSVTGQRAIAASVENISEAFAELAPDVSKLAVAFLNLFGRTAGDTRAVDLLATGLNRAIVGATNLINGLTPAKIDAAWAALGRFAGGVKDFAGRVAGWGAAIMGAVRWWKAHAEEIQHVRDVLGLVAVAVGVATGGWMPALVAGISLLVAHWDQVTGALQRVQHWFGGTSDSASATRTVVKGLQGAVADLSSWFTGKLLPALERAGKAVLPTLRDAAAQVSQSLHDNKDIVGKVQAVLSVLGIVLTEAVIPALTWLFQHGLPLVTSQFTGMLTAVNKVVLPGLRIFTKVLLGYFGSLLDGAAFAFGWIPGVGDKLKTASKQFDKFRDQVNNALNGIKDQKVSVTATIGYTTSQAKQSGSVKVGYKARGGLITGPGGPRDDAVPTMLSNKEFVVNAHDTARHRPLLEAINSGRVRGYRDGGLVMSTSTSGIPQMMAAERKALAAAAKRMAPSLSAGNVGAGVARWAPLVLQVLGMLGQSAGALGPVLSRMRRESGGNPRAINLTDINARRGDPSIGLMQTIGATFRAYAGPFRGRGIYDPLANIYAGINYATHRYGSGWVGRMTMPGGYDRGGLARGSGWMPKPTSAPERVLSPSQTVRFERAMSSAAQPVQELHFHFERYVGNRSELIRELKAARDAGQLRQLGIDG